jgi:hypothetical protein
MVDTQREFLIIKDNAKDGEIQLSLRQMEVRSCFNCLFLLSQ